MFRNLCKTAVAAGAFAALSLATAQTAVAFNPQPEPPKVAKKKASKFNHAHRRTRAARRKFVLPGTRRGFNPQPEPPKLKKAAAKTKTGFVRPGAKKGFNPQPEPPRVKFKR